MRKIALLLTCMTLAACSGGAATTGPTATAAADAAGDAQAAAPAAQGQEGSDLDRLFAAQVRVIREARLELRVEEGAFQERWDRMRMVAAGLGGYLSDAEVGVEEAGDRRYAFGTATLRIPSDRFDAALDRLADLGERRSLRVDSQDVSDEYVDLEARLRHWQAVEAFHLELLERAETVEDALAVQRRLGEIQLEAERLQGRLRYLDERTGFAAVTVSMSESAVAPGRPTVPDELAEALDQARRVLVAVFGFLIVAAAAVFPLALLGATGFGLWRLGRRVLPQRA